jgi:hypothetical protein
MRNKEELDTECIILICIIRGKSIRVHLCNSCKNICGHKQKSSPLREDFKAKLVLITILHFFSTFYQHSCFIIQHFSKTALYTVRGGRCFIN